MVKTLVDGGSGASRRLVVAGEMLELGDDEIGIHRTIGEKIAETGVDYLIGVRGLAREMVEGARNAGLKGAEFAENSDTAGTLLIGEIRNGDVVLIKGSRGVRTEAVLEMLLEKFELEKR
jgi:UDP-N-acetylmuramoyl-tripeptide--D-alanyl-D-alanine ligase